MRSSAVAWAIGAALWLGLTAAIYVTQVSSWHLIGDSDNAFVAECLDSINDHGLPHTAVNRASHRYIALVTTFDEVVDGDGDGDDDESFAEAIAPAPPAAINQFHRHSYVALYALAPFARWIDPALVLTAAKTLALMSLLAFGAVLLLRRGGGVWLALAYAVSVVAHPFFTSSLGWQVYVDFLFLPAGFLLCRGLRERPGAWSTLLWALACCLVCEKFIFVTALLTATFALLFHNGRTRVRMLLAAVGLVVLFVVVSRTARWIEPDYTVRPHYQYGRWLEILTSAASLKNSLTLLFVSFAVYVPLLWRDRRLVLLVAVALLPNLLGSVGGAEKTGWATHYHVTYFPVLAYAIYEALAARAAGDVRRGVGRTTVLVGGVLLATCHPLVFDVRNVTRGVDTDTASQWFPVQFVRIWQRHQRSGTTLEALRRIEQDVPEGATLSISRNLATTLFRGRTLDFFPIGVDRADVLVLSSDDCRRTDDGWDFATPALSSDVDTNRRFDQFVSARITARFDVEHAVQHGPWFVFGRRQ